MTETENFVGLKCALRNAASIFFSVFPRIPAALSVCAAAAAQ